MAPFPCLPLWTDVWLADTKHLKGALGRQKRDVYHHLLIAMWRTPGCRVPNNPTWLCDHLDLTADEFAQLALPIISEFCQSDGNWITQKRLMREFVRQFKISHWQSVRAKSRERNKKKATQKAPVDGAPSTSTSTPTDLNLNPDRPSTSPHVDNSPATSLATPPPPGALASSPPPPPDQPPQEAVRQSKRPEDMSLAEINQRWHPAGTRP